MRSQHLISTATHEMPMVVATRCSRPGTSVSVPISPQAGAAERYTMPQLLAVHTGRGKSATTTLPNIDAVAVALCRPPLYLFRHFQYSLSIQVNNGAQLSGNVDTGRLESLIRGFIDTWVLCQSPQCRLPECELIVEAANIPIRLSCCACGHVAELQPGVLTKQTKLVKFIRANPPTISLASALGHGVASVQEQQRRQRQRQQQHLGLPVTVQLQTDGAFESHCRRLGRWIDIDCRQDSRARRTWLSSPPISVDDVSCRSGHSPEHNLPWEILVTVLRRGCWGGSACVPRK